MSIKRKTAAVDGNEASAHVAYAFTEVAAIYPITPSSPMAEKIDEWAAVGQKNLFGQPVRLIEMQSEAGAIGAVHGASESGVLASSFTSSQGLMLMIPTMYRLAGTKQPAVLHVASRTVGTHAMSIFGDHSDVMSCRATGFAMLSSGSVQETMDLSAVAHLAAIKARIPFIHFFDGFRTSHEIQKVEVMDYEELRPLLDMDAVNTHRDAALNPEHPTLRNTVQNPDIYFQVREANNRFYDELPDVVEHYFNEINRITGRNYKLFNFYGDPEAELVIIAMGSVSGTIMDTVDYLNARGDKVGYVQVHLYRPFSVARLLETVPKTAKRVAVLDRCKEHGAVGEPLFEDVRSAFYDRKQHVIVVGGRYGLSSKDTDPAQIAAVYNNLKRDEPLNNFSVGIYDDVTGLSLPAGDPISTEAESTICCKFWGLGSDGTVGANKSSVKIISDHTPYYAQAYFEYDTKKSFGITKSHLRFGKTPIRATHLIKRADFIACHNQSYLEKYDIITELKDGGTFLLNCSWSENELSDKMPAEVRAYIAKHAIKLYVIDANAISLDLGLGTRSNMVLQSAFFRLSGVIPADDAVRYMKEEAKKAYGKKGDRIVSLNYAAIDAGADGAHKVEVPEFWKDAKETKMRRNPDVPAFIRDILIPINAQKGDMLPVSTFKGYEDGTMPMGTSAFEKRGISSFVPVWDCDKCIQCNLCAFVCPHAVIRPLLLDKKEAEDVPKGFKFVPAKGKGTDNLFFSIQTSALDCTGCSSCAEICPAKGKAIEMRPAEETAYEEKLWDYTKKITEKSGAFNLLTVKGSQFKKPLLEFSGACAGCGETPYAKLLTQMFGDRMYWANGTGCSQAWGASMPCVPYTVTKDGKGPAWSNSLFENNAEFALGMCLANKQQRANVRMKLKELRGLIPDSELGRAIDKWDESFDSAETSKESSSELVKALRQYEMGGAAAELCEAILKRQDQLTKKSVWMYGGDGWAYDIGYGGLDHVFAQGEDVNVFVVDTEVYSNTGGQASKATPVGASAQFASSGKRSSKKDLGRQMMAYGNVYIAQVAMGADPAQLIKALHEADEYPGPSLVIAYTPCIAHGIKLGMGRTQEEMRRAVKSGYWHLYRFDPRRGERAFILDSKEPSMSFQEFLDGELRFSSLNNTFPENAKQLFERAETEAAEKYKAYKKLEGQ